MAGLLPQIAVEAASASTLALSRRQRNDTLSSRLSGNDPTLMHLQLCRKPASLFGEEGFGPFLLALEVNHAVTSVELSWRFLSALSTPERIQLMEGLGSLPSMEKLMMEAIGPCDALVAALSKTQCLKTLWIGALRLSSNTDVQRLTTALERNVSLQQIYLYNIRLQVQGTYVVDNQGMVWFQEDEEKNQNKLDLNLLLTAVSNIPAMKKIQLDLQLNPDKMIRIQEDTLRALCRRRTFLMLGSCDLDDDDIAVIAQELSLKNSQLEILNLYRNYRITECGWRILARMLETNYHLTGLFTPDDSRRGPDHMLWEPNYRVAASRRRVVSQREPHSVPPSAQCRAKMDLLLRLNEKGRKKLLQDPNTTNQDWVRFLVRELHDLDMIFYVLLAAPGLFV